MTLPLSRFITTQSQLEELARELEAEDDAADADAPKGGDE